MFGKEALGAHRRYSPIGPRLLTAADRSPDGKPKQVNNIGTPRIVASAGYDPAANRELFDACQEQKRQRGESQRGIRRSSPADYPLSTRVFDLSDDCGSLMYGSKEHGRRLHLCSKYSESKGRECHRNFVDAEAALRFTLAVLKQRVVQLDGRREIRERLTQLAARQGGSHSDQHRCELDRAEERQRSLERDLRVIGANLARQIDDDVFAMIEAEFKAKKWEVDCHNQRLLALRAQIERANGSATPLEDVGRALALFDQLERITNDLAARADIAELLGKLSFLMGLRFAANPCGKKPLQIPAGGIITLGDPDSPISKKHLSGVRPPVANGGGSGGIPAGAGDNRPAVGSRSRRQEAMGKGALGESSSPQRFPAVRLGRRRRPQPPGSKGTPKLSCDKALLHRARLEAHRVEHAIGPFQT